MFSSNKRWTSHSSYHTLTFTQTEQLLNSFNKENSSVKKENSLSSSFVRFNKIMASGRVCKRNIWASVNAVISEGYELKASLHSFHSPSYCNTLNTVQIFLIIMFTSSKEYTKGRNISRVIELLHRSKGGREEKRRENCKHTQSQHQTPIWLMKTDRKKYKRSRVCTRCQQCHGSEWEEQQPEMREAAAAHAQSERWSCVTLRPISFPI